jgi:hypothetical protein
MGWIAERNPTVIRVMLGFASQGDVGFRQAQPNLRQLRRHELLSSLSINQMLILSTLGKIKLWRLAYIQSGQRESPIGILELIGRT